MTRATVPANRPRTSPTLLLALAFALFTPFAPAQENGVMMQYFHWYYPNDGSLWNQVHNQAAQLAGAGFTALWLPPAYKAANGIDDVGYGVYDLYDLGEFNQQGTIRTKYGDKNQYLAAIAQAQANGLQIYADIVLNHKGGADATEAASAVRVRAYDRNQEYGGTITIQGWTRFDFPGRGNLYSGFKWRWYHFDGVDWDQSRQEQGVIYKFRGLGKAWDWEVDTENGNYGYLLYADIDMDHPEVITELENWGVWYTNVTGVDGFRIDAIKHIRYDYFDDWLTHVRTQTGKSLFTVGEFWSYDLGKLTNYVQKSGRSMSLFDAPLHLNFFHASRGNGGYDMRRIFDNTLVQSDPTMAVTLVENHDTQPLQALESPVLDWFKPLAYALILLRKDGYPCVFYADYYGASYVDQGQTVQMTAHRAVIDTLLNARKLYNYGPQVDYFDDVDLIGWTRLGNSQHPETMAVVMTDAGAGVKWMRTGKADTQYTDATGHRSETITTNSSGWGGFPVNGGSVSVWVETGTTPGGQTSDVLFQVQNGTTQWGQNIYVVGNIPELGNWDPDQAVKLDPVNYPTWQKTITLPATQAIQWKAIKKDAAGQVIWQSGTNNNYTTPASGTGTATTSF